MRRILIISGLVAAFLSLAQNANAQYRPARIHRDRADFVDEYRRILSDSELIDAVGVDIYEETIIGARKQYTMGRKLVVSGVAGLGVGIAGIVGGAAIIASAGPHKNANDEVYFDDEDKAATGGLVAVIGSVATALGGTALTVGIPLKVIGQSRLNWVENDYNDRQRISLNVGATPNGIGLALRF